MFLTSDHVFAESFRCTFCCLNFSVDDDSGSTQRAFLSVVFDSVLAHYSMVQLMNDLQHIHVHHWDHCRLFERIETMMGDCPIAHCLSFHRHFRDRSAYSDDAARYGFYGLRWDKDGGHDLEVRF